LDVGAKWRARMAQLNRATHPARPHRISRPRQVEWRLRGQVLLCRERRTGLCRMDRTLVKEILQRPL
jgi:hypothetical protein